MTQNLVTVFSDHVIDFLSELTNYQTYRKQLQPHQYERETLELRSIRAGVKISDFIIIKQLGSGAYSEVFLARYKRDMQLYAVKRINKDKLNTRDGVRIRSEKAALANFDSQYIIKLYFVFQADNYVYFVMDYASGGDLLELLNSMGALPYSWSRIYFAQICSAVLQMHGFDIRHHYHVDSETDFSDISQHDSDQEKFPMQDEHLLMQFQNRFSVSRNHRGSIVNSPKACASSCMSNTWQVKRFVHRDLKPQNFLVSSDGRLLLADFGFAETNDRILRDSTVVGTLNYLPPESFQQTQVDERADYWALGCILYEMLTGVMAYDFQSPNDLSNYFLNGIILPERFDEIDDDAWDLISNLLLTDKDSRLKFSIITKLVEHPFFTRQLSVEDILNQSDDLYLKIESVGVLNDRELSQLPIVPDEQLLELIPNPWIPPVSLHQNASFYASESSSLFGFPSQEEFFNPIGLGLIRNTSMNQTIIQHSLNGVIIGSVLRLENNQDKPVIDTFAGIEWRKEE